MPARPAATTAIAVLGDALRNRSIRRIEVSWATGVAADWAFLVILLVVAYDLGGVIAVGVLGAVRIAPTIVAAPFATSLVQRFRGDRVLTAINVTRCVGALLAALVIAIDLPLAAAFALAALVAGVGALVRPIQYALLPAFARTPGELVAANVTSGIGEGLGTFAGPIVASAVVAGTGSAPASLFVAAAFAGAAAAVTGIHFERAADARAEGLDPSARFRIREAPHVLTRYPTTAIVVLDFVAQVFVRGLLVTLIVVASIELLGTGDAGVGLLNGALGLGGLLGALGALGLAGGRRLAGVFVLALAIWGLPLALMGAWPVAVLAFAAMFVTGVSNAVLDVAGFTLVQRGVRTADRVTVFGLMEGLFGVALLVGSLVAPALVALLGARGALVIAGAILPVMALVTWRPIVRGSEMRDDADERLALLRLDPLFAPLPLTALDLLAERMTPVSYAVGDVLMRKGDRGEEYVLLASGEVEVSDEGRILGTAGRGEGVGEIALLYDVPRTATVVARTAVDAFRIDSRSFLDAMTGPTAGAIAARVARKRLDRSASASV
jgi:hypothetical protein